MDKDQAADIDPAADHENETEETESSVVAGQETSDDADSQTESQADEEDQAEVEDQAEEEPEKDELEEAREELQSYQDRLMRLAAEFDNYKKRTSREISVLVKNASESLVSNLLPTLDNIERALQAPQTTDETKSFAEGIGIIHQQLRDTLKKEGLEVVDAVGQPFDPTIHEAVMAIERDDKPAETILEEVEKGYMLNERILRPAKVIVSRPPA